jgi:hypothetical protein
VPGGTSAYRTITREWMGTQATHVAKLQRVWPGYLDLWRSRAGIELQGADAWIHEGGWTPFPFFANLLTTGKAGRVTNREARVLDRYLGAAVNGALACDLPQGAATPELRRRLEGLRWAATAREAVRSIDGTLLEGVDPTRIALADGSVDLCHSGGALEHLHPPALRGFIGRSFEILRPGGVASHVVDHRDHLHHADPGWGFLAHLRLSPSAYSVALGHPLLYHNRLMPSEIAAMFEEAGFERIAVRRMVLPGHVWVESAQDALAGEPGIERSRLAARFRDASEADLRTAAAHYLYRRPTPGRTTTPS